MVWNKNGVVWNNNGDKVNQGDLFKSIVDIGYWLKRLRMAQNAFQGLLFKVI